MLPALFVSHGAPTFPLTDAPARAFLEGLAAELPMRPKAILVISAHWEAVGPIVNDVVINETIHDFYGFPPELYRISYPAPGSKALADRVAALLGTKDIPVGRDPRRGLDHGAWVPLRLIYPHPDIPVVQLSVETAKGPAYHLELGRLLAPLREEGVLILGSGGFTHDLSSFRDYYHALHAPAPDWVTAFADWMDAALAAGRVDDLLAYRRLAPHAARNHPTEEHLLPLFVALGAGCGEGVRRLHASTTHGILRMDAYAFGGAA
ncbi:dioxygenase [Sphingomonas oleivorans]|uniref:Dioxygenase n=1 Tax=Sphingomonas oleivorans TaxID=1735121 RepID=A0A2T5G2C1_9SPHN|nr:class III extradiol ring-cleavage dioxygenase [Sphingomonas oleivorans]PTQ13299.1 dioxygenase [Sphingomonas oleivorans]